MGNQLVATAPSQILSVESYLADASEFTFNKSLGSTRFMKVARAKFQEGMAVVKVFVIPDTTLDLMSYRTEVENITMRLKQASNCLPFQRTITTDKCAMLIRQYIKHNLYDRISTRPFYNNIERKWVAFQLLCALNQMAKCNIWHGDIKSENVLITSWNWLLLTDFASYKPTYLPDNNPADFNYFFDTSRRRTCYLAPERFTDNQTTLASSDHDIAVTHAMDIFSTGCVIAELFTDGTPLFDLSQLLAYRENKFEPTAVLNKIDDVNVREMVRHMIQPNPTNRHNAEKYLTEWREKIFPDHFYTFLKIYLGRFCETPLFSADQTVSGLHKDLDKVLQSLVYKENASDTLVILSSLLLSCVRKLKYCNCKLKALHVIEEFAKHLPSSVILERFIPYLMEFLKDHVPRVRAKAIRSLATCLTFVSQIPRSEANIFSEYILPGINTCAQDSAVPVRQAFAETIAIFAERALKFLDSPQQDLNTSYISAVGSDQPSYDTQLQLLRDLTQNKVQVMLSDVDSTVRECLLEYSVSRLCAFFGRQKANEVLLSHMITFLNDKQDWQLRSAFFKSLVSVASYIGWQSANFLKPLLQQGMRDHQEFVVSQTTTAISSLVELGLLPKNMIFELLKDTVPFLVHPCEWIRLSTVSFVCSCGTALDTIDIHCYVIPLLMPFLQYRILQVDDQQVLLSALKPPIKFAVYDLVYNMPNVKNLFDAMKTKQENRLQNKVSFLSDLDPKTENMLRKLTLKEISNHEEDMIINLEGFITKQQKYILANSSTSTEWHNEDRNDGSVINILSLGPNFLRRHADMAKESDTTVTASKSNTKKASSKKKVVEQSHDMNEEWRTMFGADNSKVLPPAHVTNKKSNSSNLSISMSQLESAAQPIYQIPEAKPGDIQFKYASCQLDLRALVHHNRDLYKYDLNQRQLEELADTTSSSPITDWRPRGLLVAHMLEHRGPIHRIGVSPSNHHFVTVSSDRSIRLWESAKLEGKSVVNRSRASCQRFGGAVRCVTFSGNEQIVCSSDDGSIHLLSVESMGTRTPSDKQDTTTPTSPIIYTYSVNHRQNGRVTDLKPIINSSVVVFTSSYGNITALDLRTRTPAWNLKHDLSNGVPTTFCVDPKQHWLCVGTARGVHICWDLRFQLPITKFSHPSMAGVRRVMTHPTRTSNIVSVVTGNNEVSVWDIETGTRQTTLWGSTAPPLSQTQKTADSVNGIHASIGNAGVCMYTGGTDCKIRLWDLLNAENSRIISGPELSNNRSLYNVTYQTRLVDGTHIIQEQLSKLRRDEETQAEQEQLLGEQKRSKISEHVVPSHHFDVITDLAILNVNQNFLVSTSRDGVVKIWK
uniref:non-specific serine/threonine protein kinase n=1 Tax=Ciona intestinalis TaxID=7719 RepID=F6XQ09_CIOIN|nr:phosphoinositide 3-kinase regulatory subunit 4 [Ciona intestinalis]|eukprot:XP_002121994.1 phosphoinositide 3-kinase regulatory subunit 4 [Ciona intestinalis]